MPPICLHLGIAEEAIARLHHPIVDENRGSYYLGSTAPDIRFFIGARREETHFLSLESEEGESGARFMLQEHPELIRDSSLSPATRAFIAGYFSHLVTDEAWIYRIYRPYFGRASPVRGSAIANLLDRVLQFELDMQERLNNKSMPTIRTALSSAMLDISVSFISASSLKRWGEFVFMSTTRKANWEDFRRFAEKYLIWLRQDSCEEQEAFFSSFDDRREEVLKMVPQGQIEAFREQSIVDSVKTAREYLG
ncbi:MAG: zinc dependent phospholipase C family protein [Chloroflexi bacterium]|nr:zinc dependent phospholipase C family protein [Chloroflexota bacterium]